MPEVPSPTPGDRVAFFYSDQELDPVVGVLVEHIKGLSENGYHIHSPLPGDPGRVVRVWEHQGSLAFVPLHLKQQLAETTSLLVWISETHPQVFLDPRLPEFLQQVLESRRGIPPT